MNTQIRIREAYASEIFADRLERQAKLMTFSNREYAADYLRQAQMLREMAAIDVTDGR